MDSSAFCRACGVSLIFSWFAVLPVTVIHQGQLTCIAGGATPFRQAAGGLPLTPRGATFGPSSSQAREAAAAGAGASSHGPVLRHAATTLSHLPEQLAAVSGPFPAGHYVGYGSGFGAQGFHPMCGLGGAYPAPGSPGPYWGNFVGMGGTRRGTAAQDPAAGAGVAAAAATATAASAPAGAPEFVAQPASLHEWAEGVQGDTIQEAAEAAEGSEDGTQRRSLSGAPTGQQLPRISTRRPSVCSAADGGRGTGYPYRHSGLERLSSTGHTLYPHLGGNAVHYSMSGAGWPVHAYMGAYGAHAMHQDVYHLGPGLSMSGVHAAGASRHISSRTYGLDGGLRRIRRAHLVRSHSL